MAPKQRFAGGFAMAALIVAAGVAAAGPRFSTEGPDSRDDAGPQAVHAFDLAWDQFGQGSRPVFADTATIYLVRSDQCIPEFEINRLEMIVETGFEVLSFTPEPWVTNLGDSLRLDLRFDCGLYETQGAVLGRFLIEADSTSQLFCFGDDSVVWDCESAPASFRVSYRGCRAGLEAGSCSYHDCPIPDYVVPESWARIKAVYR